MANKYEYQIVFTPFNEENLDEDHLSFVDILNGMGSVGWKYVESNIQVFNGKYAYKILLERKVEINGPSTNTISTGGAKNLD